jgi:phage repressor protein C with HTH and peptisase S24 domain
MPALTHGEVWTALDNLARRLGMSASGLAKAAGLDPTSFNKSKRISPDQRPRWPSTESIAKVLEATGVSFTDFAALAKGHEGPPSRGVPLIGMAQAGAEGFFDDAGFPVGAAWDHIEFPGVADENAYALEISGDSMAPLYRPGDRVLVSPSQSAPRRGDRVVLKTRGGEVMAKEVGRVTAGKIELKSLNPEYPDRTLDKKEIAWIARIVWASQ